VDEARAPNHELAEKDYMAGMKYKEIAEKYNVTINTVKSWKQRYGWTKGNKKSVHTKSEKVCTQKAGAPKGNKNAVGNDGGAPPENKNAEKHGFFSKWLPPETAAIMKEIEKTDPLDILWDNIQLQYVAIIRAQKIMFVMNQEDSTTTQIGQGCSDFGSSEKWQIQYAWDKHATFLKAQSRAMGELRSMIKQYDELLHKNWGLATEEQKQRIEKLKAETKKLEPDNPEEGTKYTGIPASMIAPAFIKVVHDIEQRLYNEYVFPGGRGSTKSSFVSLEVIDLIMKHEDTHAVIMRQVADTLRTSVYQQILWAISALGLEDEFHCTVSPLEITRKSTGQKIYFRGADDPGKVKSIKVPFGYIAILWFEELDQFKGNGEITSEEAVRKIEQSVIRGGEKAYIFKSFNPPKSANNWANKYIKIPKATRLVTHSTYKDVPPQWLGKPFMDEAEFLKEVNPTAYENEYMGVANGTGGNVFDNVVIKEITVKEIEQFDRLYNGLDWGWYPDPFHFGRMHYDAARMKLYIFMEYRCNKQSNKQTADKLREMGITENDLITCDSAEEKSVGDYRSYGFLARGAEKGPGSVEYSMKWLQSLTEIIIDNRRCPNTANEFLNYEYERDKEGNVISGYPDKDNHAIDMVRYAMNPIWKRRGQ
jgi:PBSX family phage terminase large subunit